MPPAPRNQAEIVVAGECDERLGWLMDYADITQAFKPLWEQLDHRYLNEVAGLENPTSENVARWIWEWLKPGLPLLEFRWPRPAPPAACTGLFPEPAGAGPERTRWPRRKPPGGPCGPPGSRPHLLGSVPARAGQRHGNLPASRATGWAPDAGAGFH